MIESFKLANVATYQQAGIEVTNLKEINFFYGANGSGKTTISNYLAHSSHNEERFNNCGITWKNNNSLQTLVYNKEFREKNFSSSNIAGVFTLGEATTEQVIAINNKRDEQDTINIQLNDYIAQHKIKTKEINSTHAEITEKSWSLYKKYEPNFKEALKGFQKKELFKTNILSVSKTLQALDANINIDNLKNRSITILGERPTVYQKIYMPDVTALINIEQDSIWNTIVTGQSDIDISGLIESLGCQDWVNHGRKFMTSSNKCPFCQKQTIDDEFREKIELFFDLLKIE
ncbi:AAA family ATPase [Aeromonas veronii]|uniref:AAA family ATPase n=1 Tax=Aeromonas veronii TaxID=654 RepID=UPI0035B732C8